MTNNIGLPEVTDSRKEIISIQPGDVIVCKLDDSIAPLSIEGIHNLKGHLKHAFPNTKSFILEDGMSLEVYREQGKVDKPWGDIQTKQSSNSDNNNCNILRDAMA